ncbi:MULTISPECIES: bifunctional diaminohydroxyphosphoribosylaminopyrimidine deaminase/5-amino-6-(5-phosphoribosylamino)uracil reductase RibD [Arthrobacter]|uniref:Riboflavin biosynthesis protein RibD n=1 Tax=Arthrobacter terricola TaxID=2547396 RepID=A0A4R5L159_9MICC|nr:MULTISPECIES: bifunctional diaminohydroxyphosphoribosylaminopyrimidine deaminase/5-amino-6-(5-phosphoribosylamino)uracil reductase RibD [Arthrobacter]MBT8159457.1 bifunctional diaminohydroxyphosphoribosylaminopyrimidine deaminase/5-amino-6-(5-phosphoribosylamino)uracil reductase RibD [Arthrobacter sp. GN70]TDG01399.1 bifunctional diaminohydroxyphosphoribosylaminopyrimidine deaminase/5-amino-6-(5-phosphoribosylamino)uracil reductase RibD [Arthrobacter terricola]
MNESFNLAFSTAESEAMETALHVALRGHRGANPLVGAVVLGAGGKQLVTGYHRGAGSAHAEADAINNAQAKGVDLRGTTMVVTLEPCNHTGRTGPCAQAIIDAGISRVVYAVDDPHDRAAGGARTLRAAGVDVQSGLSAEDAHALNREWFAAVRARRPFVTLHIAQTLDSRIAATDGTSQWISSPESLADNHGLRRLIDAILVGTETVRVDNPRLTARELDGRESESQPLRAVMGLRDIPADAAMRGTDGRFVHLRTREPAEALELLFAEGVRHVMVEGGSRILSAFLAAGLVDEMIIYLAPTLLGAGKAALGDLGISTLAEAQHWTWDDAGGGSVHALGRDLRLHLRSGPADENNPAWSTSRDHNKPLPGKDATDSTTGGH